MPPVPHLKGPSRGPASGGKARQLVVFLHGVGADGNDLISLAPYLAPALPDAAFRSPNGPYPCDMAPFGRQWFSLLDRSPAALARGVRQAAPILDAYLDAELAALGLADRDLALVGFSQGTMMSLFTAPRRPNPCAGVVGFSGALVDGERLADEIVSRPPMLLIHGDADMVVDPGCLAHARHYLADAGVAVEAEMHVGLGHSIDEEGLEACAAFLRKCFGVGE